MTPNNDSPHQKDFRLNPFALPAGTRGRFRMLIVAAMLVASTVGQRSDRQLWTTLQELRTKPTKDLTSDDRSSLSSALTPAQNAAHWEQLQVLLRWMATNIGAAHLLPPNAMMLFVALGASLLYLDHPRRLRRRVKTEPLTEENAPTVVSELRDWGVSLEHSSGKPDGRIFGLRRREVLLLRSYGTPRELEKAWGETMKVIVLHELGHLANQDAQEQEQAKAIWIALAALSLGLAAWSGLRTSWWFRIQVIFLLLLVWTIRAGLIRVREFYADWRVDS